MAESPSHKFGQIIGDLLEATIRGPLSTFAQLHGLYLDHKHPRPERNNKSKVTWRDSKGNNHDLDFVLEHGGSEYVKGTPKAFVETAWRRYTKHSRNKAQEIHGALVPLAETYSQYNPFLGVVLAGEFTEGSLQQLRSHGFSILYFPYQSIIAAFATVGISAAFDENTPDSDMADKVRAYEAIGNSGLLAIVHELHRTREADLKLFIAELDVSLTRKLLHIFVATLHGPVCEVASVEDAVQFILTYAEDVAVVGFVRYEVNVRYSNGDKIIGEFEEKTKAVLFLRSLK